MPNGPHRITGLPFEEELFSSEHSVKDADIQVTSNKIPPKVPYFEQFSFVLQKLLKTSANPKSAKKKKKAAEKAVAPEGEAPPALVEN